MKIIVVILGMITIGMVFIIERLGNLFGVAFSILGITCGTSLGMITLGILFPQANRQGVFWGSLVSIVVVTILGAGAQVAIYFKRLSYEYLPLRTDGCEEFGYSDYMNSTSFIGYVYTFLFDKDI